MSVAQASHSPPSTGTPAELARRARFTRAFDEHFRAVSAYALRRTTPAEAEDVVAETFLVAWRRLHEVPEDAKPWLLGVARRVLANQRRATRRRHALTERVSGLVEHQKEPSGAPVILQALARLSDTDREVLLLVAWDGLSVGEAARVLRCSGTAAKVRLHRARRRLRTEVHRLAPDMPGRPATTQRLEECHDD